MLNEMEAAINKEKTIHRPVLLLHGLGVYGESWWHQKQALSQAGYFPIAPDLPGFGKTPPDGRRWSVKGAATSALRVLDNLEIEKSVVCGLSMGGAVGLQMAISYPNRLAGLVLINTFSALRPSSFSEAFYFVNRGLRAYLLSPGDQADLVAHRIFPQPEYAEWRIRLVESIRESDPKIYRQAMIALARFNVNNLLPKINVPTMVITGAQDSTIPPKVQIRMANRIPSAQQHLIDDAGHGVIVDHFDDVNRLLLEFLEKIYLS